MDRISLMLTAGERVERRLQYDQTSASESSSFCFSGGGGIQNQWLIGTDRITIPEREREKERERDGGREGQREREEVARTKLWR